MKTLEGLTMVQLAKMQGEKAIAKMLESAGKAPMTPKTPSKPKMK